ncbi:MAG: Ku protein [Gemmatimonadetes bacterium]|nr:Ku protein [Gemmatimonadota bacterium]
MAERTARDEARARAFWSGTVSFGLVSIPVYLYPANTSSRVSLRMLAPDGTPLRRRYVNPETGKPVDYDALVRGYELDSGEFVVLTDDELEALAPEKSRDIDLRRFVDVAQLDPVFFERAYYLAPAGDSNKAYRLLAQTMEKAGQAGIATFVMRTKEYLVAIVAEEGILRAETLRFAGEVRASDDVGLPEPVKPPAKTVKAMEKAIAARVEDDLDEDELRDEDSERLLALVEEKRKKKKDVVRPKETAADEDGGGADVIDLMEVLKRSLSGQEGGRAAPKRASRRGGPSADDLREMTKAELYERAQKLDVPGRSSMTKEELVDAVSKAS